MKILNVFRLLAIVFVNWLQKKTSPTIIETLSDRQLRLLAAYGYRHLPDHFKKPFSEIVRERSARSQTFEAALAHCIVTESDNLMRITVAGKAQSLSQQKMVLRWVKLESRQKLNLLESMYENLKYKLAPWHESSRKLFIHESARIPELADKHQEMVELEESLRNHYSQVLIQAEEEREAQLF